MIIRHTFCWHILSVTLKSSARIVWFLTAILANSWILSMKSSIFFGSATIRLLKNVWTHLTPSLESPSLHSATTALILKASMLVLSNNKILFAVSTDWSHSFRASKLVIFSTRGIANFGYLTMSGFRISIAPEWSPRSSLYLAEPKRALKCLLFSFSTVSK